MWPLARQHHLGTHASGGKRQAPGIGMEHRHHRQEGVPLAHIQHVAQALGDGVQVNVAVAVDHALGQAGRGRGVAHAGWRAFRQFIEGKSRIARRDQILVGHRVRQRGCRHPVGQHHKSPDRFYLVGDALERRQQVRIDENGRILAVVQDVGDVLISQAQVDRVQHGAGARQREVQLEMAVGVPGQRGHPVTGAHADACQAACQATRALVQVAIGVAVQAAIRQAGDDLVVREIARRPLQQQANVQFHRLSSSNVRVHAGR